MTVIAAFRPPSDAAVPQQRERDSIIAISTRYGLASPNDYRRDSLRNILATAKSGDSIVGRFAGLFTTPTECIELVEAALSKKVAIYCELGELSAALTNLRVIGGAFAAGAERLVEQNTELIAENARLQAYADKIEARVVAKVGSVVMQAIESLDLITRTRAETIRALREKDDA